MNKEKNVKKAYLWNMIGSISYSASSFLYLLVVTRLCGVELAGFFSLSYATSQLLLNVGRYGMRTYQATDLKQKFLFSEYGVSRILSCLLMMMLGIVYSVFSFSNDYIIISIFIIMMKMNDAVEDVFHGNFQQKYHVETMGKMLAIRNIYSAVYFIICLAITKSLLVTCTTTAISSLALGLVVNIYFTQKQLNGLTNNLRKFAWKNVVELFKICTPLFIATFLSLLIYNIPKYAMSGILSDEYQTYYSIMFMPSFVITLMCEFVFKPLITTIAGLWWNGERKSFAIFVLKILGVVGACCVMIVIGGHLLGRTLLELVYGVDLSEYKAQFIVLLIGGGVSASVYMVYNILIAIRKGKYLTPVYAIAVVLTVIPAKWMIEKWKIMGAALNYLYSSSILFLLLGIVLIGIIVKRPKEKI